MFYSYKGGSGRTVAVANVSAALTKLGKRVAVLDLDFEAPGLHYVFGADRLTKFKNGNGIQQYLRGDIDLEEMEKHVYIDMFDRDGPLCMYAVPEGALLLYIMASPKVAQVDSREPKVAQRMRLLLESLQQNQRIDYVLIDAASGVRDAYSIAADISDEMMIFFRWSTQHVEGTIRMAQYMRLLREFGQSSAPFRLVASATPGEQELEALGAKDRDMFLRLKEQTREKIERTLEECGVTPPSIFHDIPELVWLKWKETVTVFSEEVTEYEKLARKIVEREPAATTSTKANKFQPGRSANV
jgi:MinD-like ATPase involved in chromosome partitioning or flagellar assembly